MNTAIIYGTPTCTWCDKAEDLLESKGYEVNKIDITSSRKHYDDMQKVVGNNVRTVPQIILNDEYVGGYGEVEQYLNK
jgi:glutaredoxin